MILRNWYTSIEMQRGKIEWEELAANSTHMFEFFYDHPSIYVSLQVIRTKIFEDIPVLMTNFHQISATIQHWMECYNVTGKPDDDDPHDIHIPESEGTPAMEGISSDKFQNPLKKNKNKHWFPREPKIFQYRRLLG